MVVSWFCSFGFFLQNKCVIEEANLHTCAATESLPEQSGGTVPLLRVPPSAAWAEQLSYSHYQPARPSSAFRMINTCSNSCRAFRLWGRKAQPGSTPALRIHPLTVQLFFPFPPLSVALMCPHRPLSHSSSPTTLRPACCHNTRAILRLSCPHIEQELCWAAEPCHGQSQSNTFTALARASPSPMPGKSGSITVRLRSSWDALVRCFVLFYNGSISQSNAADLTYCISLFLIRFCSLFPSTSESWSGTARCRHGCSLC